jgi:hypothetical protein
MMLGLPLLGLFLTCLVLTPLHAQQCDRIVDVARFDCHPESNPSQGRCEARGCCWRPPLQHDQYSRLDDVNVPYCYYPTDFPTYRVVSSQTTDFGQRIRLHKDQATFMPDDIVDLTADVILESAHRVRVRIYDSESKRYEVPLDVPSVTTKATSTEYDVKVQESPFAIMVTRKVTGDVL